MANEHKVRIAPSILSADFSRLGEEVRAVQVAGAELLHFDVMDNHYVPNLSIGPMVCAAIRPHISIPIDVHLMVQPVDALIPMFAKAGANRICFHPEASLHVDRSLSLVREGGCEAGLALNPATSLTVLAHVLDKLDFVLIMSVNPGFGGQQFLPSSLPKIAALRQLLLDYEALSGRRITIEVDGGVTCQNIAQIRAHGADTFVAGNAVFGAPDAGGGYSQIMQALKTAAD